MKTAKYIRVSTTEQNIDRQTTTTHKQYIDKCSGSIPFNERANAIKLLNDIANKKIDNRQIIVKFLNIWFSKTEFESH